MFPVLSQEHPAFAQSYFSTTVCTANIYSGDWDTHKQV